jgi:hypothetical protein
MLNARVEDLLAMRTGVLSPAIAGVPGVIGPAGASTAMEIELLTAASP